MNTNNKKSRHSGHGNHKGHSWMMLLCLLLMVGLPLLILSSTDSPFNVSLLGSALLPLILCLVMHGVMMKYMMTNSKTESGKSEESQLVGNESKKLDHKAHGGDSFNA